ncbi:MAG: SsrA-binding protein SmpB [Deltaproteobacteria bacterium]|nr:SsrA-binding protein SmpB [Deltaproteobacteria bacterium]
MSKKNKDAPGEKIIARNSKALSAYAIDERFEAGLVLTGSEVKSLRAGKADLESAYAAFHGSELFVHSMHIAEYPQAKAFGHEAKRERKLLMHRSELEKLRGRVSERGFALIPLRLYFKEGKVKLEIALAKGRKTVDRREHMRSEEQKREVAAELGRRQKGGRS